MQYNDFPISHPLFILYFLSIIIRNSTSRINIIHSLKVISVLFIHAIISTVFVYCLSVVLYALLGCIDFEVIDSYYSNYLSYCSSYYIEHYSF